MNEPRMTEEQFVKAFLNEITGYLMLACRDLAPHQAEPGRLRQAFESNDPARLGDWALTHIGDGRKLAERMYRALMPKEQQPSQPKLANTPAQPPQTKRIA